MRLEEAGERGLGEADRAHHELRRHGSAAPPVAMQGKDRRPLFGTLTEIREDIARYAEAGLTELFLEGNFNPRGARIDDMLRVMEEFAPGAAAPDR